MRIVAIAALCAFAALPASAQQVEVIKAKGANAAGVCAGALDLTGRLMSRNPNPDPAGLQRVSQTRDFFAELPPYPAAEIANAASAFITLMSDRIATAPDASGRLAVEREIVEVATRCYETSLTRFDRSASQAGSSPAPTTVLPTQPLTTTPLVTEPLVPAQ